MHLDIVPDVLLWYGVMFDPSDWASVRDGICRDVLARELARVRVKAEQVRIKSEAKSEIKSEVGHKVKAERKNSVENEMTTESVYSNWSKGVLVTLLLARDKQIEELKNKITQVFIIIYSNHNLNN